MFDNFNELVYFVNPSVNDLIFEENPTYRLKYSELYGKEFDTFCRKQIFPIFNKYKNRLNRNIPSIFSVFIKLLIVFLISTVVILIFKNVDFVFFIMFFIYIASAYYFFNERYKEIEIVKKTKRKMKKELYPVLFSKICLLKYEDKEDFNLINYIKKLYIVKKRFNINKVGLDDNFVLSYKDSIINIAEVKFDDSIGTSSVSEDVMTTSHVVLLKTKSNKKFKGLTLITRNIQDSKHALYINNLNINTQNVLLEDNEFNNLFKVETTDQIEARYLLTPSFMHRLKEFININPNMIIDISFEKQNVNIIINAYNYDMFEVEKNDIKYYRNILIQVKELIDIFDSLKLEQKIGL